MASAGDTRPPGKAMKPPKKRSVSARRTAKTWGEPRPRVSSTLAASAMSLKGHSGMAATSAYWPRPAGGAPGFGFARPRWTASSSRSMANGLRM